MLIISQLVSIVEEASGDEVGIGKVSAWCGKVMRNDVNVHEGYNAARQLMVAVEDHTKHVDCWWIFG